MARIAFPLSKTAHECADRHEIADVSALAEKFKVGNSLNGNTPSPTRDSFTWMIAGGSLRVVRFTRHLQAMR